LEPHSQTDDTPDSRAILEGQLRENYGRVVYSHKTHEKCADILLSRLSKIKVLQIVLSAVTTAGFLSVIFDKTYIGVIIGGIVSVTLLTINAYTKDHDLGSLAQKHKQSANDLWLIREKYMSLLVDVAMGERPLEMLQSERDKLVEQLHEIYGGAPATTYQAYQRAQQALKQYEDMTFSDEEIDAFLPHQLKRSLSKNKT
jgi:hypothetical protein